ncbi:MAG: DUF2478 domain-containing protein [Anaerolineae bacterium]|nr:DUF2478 domain-containing protein [Anaerolineae bacterium]
MVLLTGAIGSGKTTACLGVVALCRAQGIPVGGLLSLAVRDAAGQRVAIQVEDLATGRQRILARVGEGAGDRIGSYVFSGDAVAWALDALRARRDADGLLVVDEVGPLELWEGKGLAPALTDLRHRAERGGPLLVVVREGLVGSFLGTMVPIHRPIHIFRVALHTRDDLPRRIFGALGLGHAQAARARNPLGPGTSKQVHEAGKEPFGAGRPAVA